MRVGYRTKNGEINHFPIGEGLVFAIRIIFYKVYAIIRTLDLTLGLRCHVIMDFHDQGSTLVGGYTK